MKVVGRIAERAEWRDVIVQFWWLCSASVSRSARFVARTRTIGIQVNYLKVFACLLLLLNLRHEPASSLHNSIDNSCILVGSLLYAYPGALWPVQYA